MEKDLQKQDGGNADPFGAPPQEDEYASGKKLAISETSGDSLGAPSHDPFGVSSAAQFLPNRRKILNYFLPYTPPDNSGANGMIAIGGVLIFLAVVLGLAGASAPKRRNDIPPVFLGAGIAGFCGIIFAGLGLSSREKSSPPDAATDEEMDRWLAEELRMLMNGAHAKLGIDEAECVAEPVWTWGPCFMELASATFRMKKGKDNVTRFSLIEFTVIHFTEHQLLAFQCAYDRVTGNPLHETTEEYFYRDVVSVGTKTEGAGRSLDSGGSSPARGPKTRRSVVLTTTAGTVLSFNLRDEEFAGIAESSGARITDAQKTVAAVRRMIRDRKMA